MQNCSALAMISVRHSELMYCTEITYRENAELLRVGYDELEPL
jgi:hypothetical protein